MSLSWRTSLFARKLRQLSHVPTMHRRSLVVEELEDRLVPSTLIPVSNRRDLVFDAAHNMLDITTSAGTVQRYDLASQTLLAPISVGTSLNGADISPDGNSLYVTESQTANSGAQAMLHKVNLNDGSVTNLLYNTAFMEGGSFDIALGSQGRGLFDGIFLGSGWVPVRQVDLATDALSTRADRSGGVRLNTQIQRSADRGLFVFTEADSSDGPISLYDAISDKFIASGSTNTFLDNDLTAVNRNGTLIAVELNGGITIFDRGLNIVKTLPNLAGGIVFDPVRDILYVGNSNGTVVGYDTNTWAQRYSLSIGESYSQSLAFGNGVMTISNDGSLLFVSTPSGVRMINVPPLQGTNTFVVSGFPMPSTAGSAGSFTVSAVDAQGNPNPNYTGTVHISSSDPQAILPADYTFTAADQGKHAFPATLITAGVQTISVRDTATSVIATQGNIYVNPAAVSNIAASGYISPTVAGASHNFTVTLRDAYNNVATNYRGVVTFTSSDSQAGLPFSYLFSATDAGTHTFGATLKTAGTQSITVRDSGTGVTGTQSGITVTPAGATSLIVSGYPSPTTAGAAQTFSVRARDAYGNTATGYTGTVHFTSSDNQATLPANYTFTTSDAGVHTFTATLRTAGSRSITATDTAVGAVITGSQTVTVNPATTARLSITPTGGDQVAGTPFTVLVRAVDAYGNTTPGYTGTVHFTSADPQATLPADYTFTSGDGGQHTFTVTLRTVQTGPANGQQITVSDTSGSISSGSTFVFLRAAAADHFQLYGPATVTANSPFALSLGAFDPYGNQATGYLGTVTFSSSDSTAVLPANYTFNGIDHGYHTFTSAFTLHAIGNQTVTATDTSNASITNTVTIAVNPQIAGLHFVLSPSQSSVAAGSPFNVTVTALDGSGNVAINYTGTVHFTSSDTGSQSRLPADYTFTSADAGVHTFASFVLTKTGTQTVTAADPGVTDGSSAGSTSIQVTPSTVTQFIVTGFPSPTTAGDIGNFSVTALDGYGNVATNYAGTVTFTSSDTKASLPAAYTFQASDAGVHNFTAALKTAGTQSLTVTQSTNSLIRGVQSGITVNPGVATQLKVSPYPFVTAGVSFFTQVYSADAYGNVAAGYLGTVHFTSSDPNATLPADYTFTVADQGSHNFGGFVLTTAGTQTVTATDTQNPSFTSTGSTSVSPGPVYSIYAYQNPQTFSAVAGQAFTVTVEAHDRFGNIATSYRGMVTWTSSDSQSTRPPAYTFTAADNGVHTYTNAAVFYTAGWQSMTAFTTTSFGSAQGVFSANVSPAAASRLVFTGTSPATAGTPTSFSIMAKDPYYNTVTGFTGTVHFTTTDPSGTVPADYAFQGSDQGMHTFTNGATFFTAGSQNITVTSGSISGINSWYVQAAPANHFRVTTPATATAGQPLSATVTALDAYNNVTTNYFGSIHLTSSDGSASLPADYSFTSTDQGSHTFASGVTLFTAGNQSVTAADKTTNSITGASTVAVSAASAVRLVLSAPTTTTAGAPFSYTVTAFDGYNNVATGYTGTVHFTSSDAQAVLPADYTFTAADAGTHSFGTTLKTAGTQSLTATDTANSSLTASQTGISVSAAAASTLLVSGYASPTTAGTAQGFTVTAFDAYGNVATGYNGTVHFASSDGQAALPADYTFSAADAGTHTFTATLKTAGTQSLTATDTASNSLVGSQSGIAVNPAAASALLLPDYPSPTTAGTAQSFTVTALDAYGNVATGYSGTVHFTSSDAQAVLPADYTFTSADAGRHTFTATLKTAGSQSLTATDSVNSLTASQIGITVNPAAASSLVLAGYASPATAGTSQSFTVTARDAYGNLATGYTGMVHFTSSDAQASLPADYTFSAADAGTHTFSATLKTAGTQSLSAGDTANNSLVSTQIGITVNAAAASTMLVAGYASSTTAGVAQSFTVTLRDAYGNLATGYRGTVSFSSSDAQASLPTNYTFTAADGGTHTFTATLKTAGTQSLTAKDTANSALAGTQSAITVNAAAASTLVMSGYVSSTVAGTAHNFTVTARDAYGNLATGYRGTVTFTSSDAQASLPANYAFTAADAGTHTFSATLKTAGSQSITARDTVTASIGGSQTGITVTAAAAASFAISAPATPKSGTPFSITVTARDAYGNVATGYRGTVHFTSSDHKANLPGNYTFTAADSGVHTFTVSLKTRNTQSITVTDTINTAIFGTVDVNVK